MTSTAWESPPDGPAEADPADLWTCDDCGHTYHSAEELPAVVETVGSVTWCTCPSCEAPCRICDGKGEHSDGCQHYRAPIVGGVA